jgi:hypothetical protein
MTLVRHHEHFKFERSEGVYFRMTRGFSRSGGTCADDVVRKFCSCEARPTSSC